MTFLHGQALFEAIREISKEKSPRCAVAFWGSGACDLFAKNGVQIICNLRMGGTNPYVIKALLERKITVKQHDRLHAKVYLGAESAVVSSANASANGLGFEGRELGAWEETGILVEDENILKTINKWFEDLWQKSLDITDADIRAAIERWRLRQFQRPTVKNISDYHFDKNTMPLIYPYGNDDWDLNPDVIKGMVPRAIEFLKDRVGSGIDIDGKQDKIVCKPGRWALWVRQRNDGQCDQRTHPAWVKIGSFMENAFHYDGEAELKSVALKAEDQNNEPFKVDIPAFLNVFYDLMDENRYELLEDFDGDQSWFSERRVTAIFNFWTQLQNALAAQ